MYLRLQQQCILSKSRTTTTDTTYDLLNTRQKLNLHYSTLRYAVLRIEGEAWGGSAYAGVGTPICTFIIPMWQFNYRVGISLSSSNRRLRFKLDYMIITWRLTRSSRCNRDCLLTASSYCLAICETHNSINSFVCYQYGNRF